eukprot:m.451715 g.451715  ORF g.451715 m.451715 type:complete len:459 (+) comp20324_c4_seq2:851-2227(+)
MGAAESKIDEHPYGGVIAAQLRATFDKVAGDGGLSRDQLVSLFAGPRGADKLGGLMFDYATVTDQPSIPWDSYQHLVAALLGLADHPVIPASDTAEEEAVKEEEHDTRRLVFNVFAGSTSGSMDREAVRALCLHACVLGAAAGGVVQPLERKNGPAVADVLVASITTEETVSFDKLDKWQSTHCPDFFLGILKWIEIKAVGRIVTEDTFEEGEDQPQLVDWSVPQTILGDVGSSQSLLQCDSLAVLIASHIPLTFRNADHWALLYNSTKYGLSLNRFKHHCFHYRGPALVVVRDTKGHVFGACVDQELREGEAPYGGASCALFTLDPKVAMIGRKPIRVWLNAKTRHKAHGLGFGAQPDSPDTADLWLSDDLSKGVCRVFPWVAPGCYEEFSVATLEVWGCGDLRLTAQQALELKRDDHFHEHRQKAQRPGRWEENADRVLLNMAGVTGESRVATDQR